MTGMEILILILLMTAMLWGIAFLFVVIRYWLRPRAKLPARPTAQAQVPPVVQADRESWLAAARACRIWRDAADHG
jgi:uncharacterized SAM-binding protein YcdF (DUF218 family)